MTARRIVVLCLAAAGVGLLVFGGQRWLDERAAKHVVDEFLAAVREGDRDRVLAHLSAPQRRAVEAHHKEDDSLLWQPTADFRWTIRRIRLDGNEATAELSLERDGFYLEAVLRLTRSRSSSWKIDAVEEIHRDPGLDRALRQAAREEGERMADELRDALQDRPGVTVERTATTGMENR